VGSEEKLALLSLHVLIYGDVSLRDIMRKYYRYGKSLKVLKCTPYSFMTSVSRKGGKYAREEFTIGLSCIPFTLRGGFRSC
jgi:hypothetical protein